MLVCVHPPNSMTTKAVALPMKATHQADSIGPLPISCAVLNNRERIISIRSFANFLGVKGGGAYWKSKKEKPDVELLPEFVSAKFLEDYIDDEVRELLTNTLNYTAINGQPAGGIRAIIIPKICDVWIRALVGGKLTDSQKKVALNAQKLQSALAGVGITALIDEATGFQKLKDEYSAIVERYVAKELQPWIKTFGEDYYQQIYRLKGWDWNRFAVDKKNHPWAVANYTNRIIYEKLPKGILDELNRLNPIDEKGNRKHKQFQHLTPTEGYVHLLKHMGYVLAILERHQDGSWESALHEIDVKFPSKRDSIQLSMEDLMADGAMFDRAIDRASLPSRLGKRIGA